MNPTDTPQKSLPDILDGIEENAFDALFGYRQTGTGLRLANIVETDLPALVKAVRYAVDHADYKDAVEAEVAAILSGTDGKPESASYSSKLTKVYEFIQSIRNQAEAKQLNAAWVAQESNRLLNSLKPAPSPIPAAKVEEKKSLGE
jgi:hypothetical protein